ncbi:NHLP bacteriocin export ABC transporter permease/ATPase subunit [Petralouisia muris]|uniref:NHLP bacteriocin export ABC transporter permease/ATPase subunit n=1 Tax=Petralouisia muris TaxID=3032872 RepID=A0AC61RT03_9FIRM|nr:NHLP bacteriocin export ABC transporter permease/ATPase subunit [Petralouisia muris]TGY92621.1 NHLP bacteriocin export ABC transporter permease/ATPase subunit [Petralouisia muris]
MGWFDEQIKQRKQNDQDVFTDAFINIAGAVMGSRVSAALNDERQQTKNAFDEILRFYHINTKDIPDNITDRNEQLEYLLRPHGITRRTVTLSKGWYKDAIGAMLGIRKSDGMVVALIPTGFSGYSYRDMETGKYVKINGKNQELFEEEAIAFYKPLPLKEIGISDLMRYILGTLSPADFVMTGASALAVTLIGMLSPKLNNLLFSRVIEDGSTQILLAITVFMICVTLSSLLINGVKSLIIARINTKMSISVQAAVMSRLMSLPAGFFKNYSSGELSARAQCSNSLCEMLVSVALTTGLTSVFSLIYISQIFVYAPALVMPSLIITLATVVFTVVSAFVQMKVSKKKMELSSKESGMSYALISGVQKIKLSGAEMRAFARWGNLYAEEARLAYNPPMFLKINSVISSAISLAGTLMMYWIAVSSRVSVADYYAFNTAYGMVSGAFISLAGIALTVAQIKPIMDMVEPILKAVPEISEGKQMITRLSGGIELDNVSFRYNENMPLVIDDLSLKIRPGQYVAIVGATGCGKSTLLRLMLGFESPQKGAVYVDGKDIAAVDLKSLRRNIGVVMQNGKLFTGDIFSNIIISAPWLTMDEAWHAAELSGIAEDIRRMPMGMHTMISEGSGGISGGQRQRLMIARAIAPKPSVLMFDEATSALDNLTQKTVSESLDSLKCTRIVIAHRLSTIKQCDRILVLDKGKVIEDGTYDELIQGGGFFAELVARQRVDAPAELRT